MFFFVVVLTIVLVLQLLIVAATVNGQWIDPQEQLGSSCPKCGCPMFPLDIVHDHHASEAFSILSSSSSTSTTERKAQAIQTLKASGDKSKVVLTLTGFKGGPVPNQDAAVIHSPFKIYVEEEEDDNDNLSDVQLIGVFDGHGTDGELTSNFAAKEIPKRLAERLSKEFLNVSSPPSSSVTSIPEEIVIEALKGVFIETDKLDPSEGRGGCTATVVLQLGSKLFVANAGDSVSFIGVASMRKKTPSNDTTNNNKGMDVSVEVIYRTREDKPDLPDERKRILEAGGYVHIPDSNYDVPRAYHIDQFGNAMYGLAMSRSLGDWLVQGVIAEPIVDVIDIERVRKSYLETCHLSNEKSSSKRKCDDMDPDSIRFFAVSMSDGMADYLEVEDVAQTLATSFFAKSSASFENDVDGEGHIRHPLTAAEALIRKAARIWDADMGGQYRDDIVVAATTLPLHI